MKAVSMPFALAILAAGAPILLNAVELKPITLQAWDDYISAADSSMQARLDAQRPFLWAEEVPERRARLQRGEVPIAPVSGRGTRSVPNGLIHDWIGAIFIPEATLEGLLAVIHNYDSYPEFYKPVVADAKVLACTDRDQSFSMVWHSRVLFVNAAIEGQYQAHDFVVDERRGYSITATTQVQEIEGYGHSDAHLLPPDQGNGFIWRLHSILRYEERDGGLYLELEAIALTRDIPVSLRWMVKPVVNHLSTASLATSLRQTRDAANLRAGQPDRPGLCAGGSRNSGKAAAGGGN
jgi:hypothetical protein